MNKKRILVALKEHRQEMVAAFLGGNVGIVSLWLCWVVCAFGFESTLLISVLAGASTGYLSYYPKEVWECLYKAYKVTIKKFVGKKVSIPVGILVEGIHENLELLWVELTRKSIWFLSVAVGCITFCSIYCLLDIWVNTSLFSFIPEGDLAQIFLRTGHALYMALFMYFVFVHAEVEEVDVEEIPFLYRISVYVLLFIIPTVLSLVAPIFLGLLILGLVFLFLNTLCLWVMNLSELSSHYKRISCVMGPTVSTLVAGICCSEQLAVLNSVELTLACVSFGSLSALVTFLFSSLPEQAWFLQTQKVLFTVNKECDDFMRL